MADGHGLFLRIRPSGAKSWIFRFRMPGKRQISKMTLGNLEDVTLKEARTMLVELRKQVREGIDPRQTRAASIDENIKAKTMQELFDAWIDFTSVAKTVSSNWIKRHQDRWRLHLKKPLSNMLVRDVTRADLASSLEAMTRKGTREETRKALTTLNLMLDYALTHRLIDENVARTLKPKDFGATANKPRKRVLSLHEMRLLWKALDDLSKREHGLAKTATLTIFTVTAIKILILTAARRAEVAAMRWEEVDFENGIWTLPSERTKNRQGHTIYLSDLALKLLNELKPFSGHSLFVFDTGRIGQKGHLHVDTLTSVTTRLRGTATRCKHTKKKFYPLADLNPFSIHDIRRSVATGLGEHLKIHQHIIERLLNHQPENKLIAIYQRAVYAEEQKAAWLAWGKMVEHQIARDPENVVPFKKSISA